MTSERSSRSYTALTVLGAACALWAIFLWRELLRARAGETPFCGFGESVDCGTLWSAAFASTVHHSTGVPVAGWGLVWGLVATFLPLAALASRNHGGRRDAASTAIELTAAAGLSGLVVLLAASAAEGLFCTSCALTYLLTAAYAAVAFLGPRHRSDPRSPHGVTLAVAATAVAYLAVLYPGLKTPANLGDEGQRALEAAARSEEATAADAPTMTEPDTRDDDRRLREFIAGLNLQALQGLVDTLYMFRTSSDLDPEEPRVLAAGAAGARVLITEFSDILCSHCATLHETVAQISTLLPPESFKLDARHFPLDGGCNPHLQVRGPESVRCLAARAQICVEDSGRLFELSGALIEHQDGLTAEQVFELAAPFISRAALEKCIDSPATARKLSEDIEYAWRYRPEGTPLVLINGRRGHQFGPFLYAIVLAGGDPDHPAFASLPAPSAAGLDGHVGHQH